MNYDEFGDFSINLFLQLLVEVRERSKANLTHAELYQLTSIDERCSASLGLDGSSNYDALLGLN